MPDSGPVASAPLWRPVAAYAFGIVIAANIDIVLAVVAAGVILAIFPLIRKNSIYMETAKSFLITALFVLAGIGSAYLYERDMPAPLSEDEAIYKCVVTEEPYFKGKTWRCVVDVVQRMDGTKTDDGTKAILYLADTVDFAGFTAGDCFYVNTAFSLPYYNEGYCKYLLRNSICGTGYVSPGNLHYIGHVKGNDINDIAGSYREKIKDWYSAIGFEGDELSVLSALTLGVKTEISDELKEDYSVSGASHVLALSGLHVGLIFLVINLLLYPLSLIPAGKYISWVVMTLLLFAFAVFTGLSPSVIRACFMMSALGFTGIIMRGGTSLNTLFLVALCLLVYNPMYIYNISFLLSFVAVLFILLFRPVVMERIRIKNRALRYIVDLFVISILAQIGVTPIVAYYFGSFSLFGVLSSVIIVPILTVLMYVIVLMLLLSWWSAAVSVLSVIVGYGIGLMNCIVTFFSSLPSSLFTGLQPWTFEIILFYFMAATLIYMVNRVTPLRFRLFLAGVVAFLAVGNLRILDEYGKNEIRLMSDFNGTQCSYQKSFSRYDFNGATDSLIVISSDVWQYGKVAGFGDKVIFKVDTPFYRLPLSDKSYEVDYLWISRGAKGRPSDMDSLFLYKTVILDSSLTPYYYNLYKNIADSLSVPVIDMKKKGRHIIKL